MSWALRLLHRTHGAQQCDGHYQLANMATFLEYCQIFPAWRSDHALPIPTGMGLWNQGRRSQRISSCLHGLGAPWPSQRCTQESPGGLPPAQESALGSDHCKIPEEDAATFDGLPKKAEITPQAPLVTLKHFKTEKYIIMFKSQTWSLNLVGQEFLFSIVELPAYGRYCCRGFPGPAWA